LTFRINLKIALFAATALTAASPGMAAPGTRTTETPTTQGPQSNVSRPDIILFIADDLSREDVSAYGSPDARTPNMDQLAKEGLKFTNAFAASPTCTPSRSSMLTGDYPMRNGAHANHSAVKNGIKTLPAYLQALGYRVVIAGKTDFGERSNFPFEYFPASVIQPPPGRGVLWANIDTMAIDHLLATRDKKQPLALIVASFAPHVPWPDANGYDPARLTVPEYLLDTQPTREARTRYLTKVSQADRELGEVRASVAKYGDTNNTLFLFTADQGAQFPFAKWNLYDAGIATPLMAVWPGHISPDKTTGAMVSLVDLLPTMEAAAGGPPIEDIDGQSFLPVLTGKQNSFHSEIYAAHSGVLQTGPNANIAPMRAIRTERYKLIVNFRPDIKYVNAVSQGSGRDHSYWQSWLDRAQTDPKAAAVVNHFYHRQPVELYDMRADPYEQHNLVGNPAYASTLTTLRKKLDAWIVQQGERPDHVALPSEAMPGHFPYAQGGGRRRAAAGGPTEGSKGADE
jgi:arylsulfatase A-like enzyme